LCSQEKSLVGMAPKQNVTRERSTTIFISLN
jgi:hypothetical protein